MHFVLLVGKLSVWSSHVNNTKKIKTQVKLHFVSSPALDVFAHVDMPFVSSLALHFEMHLWLGRGV